MSENLRLKVIYFLEYMKFPKKSKKSKRKKKRKEGEVEWALHRPTLSQTQQYRPKDE